MIKVIIMAPMSIATVQNHLASNKANKQKNTKLPYQVGNISHDPILTFLAKHVESFIPRAGHIDNGIRSQIREKLKISM